MRRRRFLPGPLPARALSRYSGTERGRTGSTRGRSAPRDHAGIISGATLAWMPVVHTRSHQQAAGMKYAAGAGDVDKHGCDDSSKIVHHIVPQGKFLHSWPEWRRIPFTSDALGQVLKGQ